MEQDKDNGELLVLTAVGCNRALAVSEDGTAEFLHLALQVVVAEPGGEGQEKRLNLAIPPNHIARVLNTIHEYAAKNFSHLGLE